MIHEILVIEDEDNLIHTLKKLFKSDTDTSFKVSHSNKINEFLLDIPSLIIINEDNINTDSLLDICKVIRENEDNSITPIMVLTSDNTIEHERSILKNEIEFYLVQPIDDKYFNTTKVRSEDGEEHTDKYFKRLQKTMQDHNQEIHDFLNEE